MFKHNFTCVLPVNYLFRYLYKKKKESLGNFEELIKLLNALLLYIIPLETEATRFTVLNLDPAITQKVFNVDI